MIKKLLLSTVAITALTGTAFAADLPSRRAPPVYVPPPAIPVFTWTGLYVGGQVGYEFGSSTAVATNNITGAGLATGGKPSGIIGGAHIGYNWSAPTTFMGGFGGSSLVFGLEGDVDGSNYRSNYLVGAVTDATKQNIQGSVRGRLGFGVDRALFYATGGAAFGGMSNTYLNTLNGLGDSASHTRLGYTLGAGVEYAITNNWSVRAEYRYTDFGKVSDPLSNSTAGIINVRHRETDNRVQAGFSYKFDTFAPTPVVARY